MEAILFQRRGDSETMDSAITSAAVTVSGFQVYLGSPLEDVERLVILKTLEANAFNRTHTAKTLRIGIRTLQRKLRDYEGQGFAIYRKLA